MMDTLDRRVLGAIRFVDSATRNRVEGGLTVESPQAVLRVNRLGLWVIHEANGLEAHTKQFESQPAAPPLESIAVTLTVNDPAGRYLARRATVRLPRDPDPAKANRPESLFRPIDIALFRAPASAASPGWAVIRAHVKNSGTGAPLGGALLRVIRARDSQVLAQGLSDSRGEAMLIVPGIPVTTFNNDGGPPLATEVNVNIQAIFDPAASGVVDPDAIDPGAGLPTASVSVNLAARREVAVQLAITVP